MTSSTSTELALRGAVNTIKQQLQKGEENAKAIKANAESRARDLVTAKSTASNLLLDIDAQNIAITVAVKCLQLAYVAVQSQLTDLKKKRLGFDKERQAGISTFIIPMSKEETQLSKQERIIKSFIDFTEKNTSFTTYFGIQNAVLEDADRSIFYSVLPFYRMSANLGQQIASTRTVEKQRNAVQLFFISAFPEAISDIDIKFQTDGRFGEFFKSVFSRDNYLNDIRAPRLIMMSLANLLWNLEHPVDINSGFRLSLQRCIELCTEAEQLLNLMLTKQGTISIIDLDNEDNELVSYVRKVEIHIKALRLAYAEEQLQQVNIEDITNSAHSALRVMDKSIFKLIYVRTNAVTKKIEHDENAAEDLAYTVSHLNQMLSLNPTLINYFQPYARLAPKQSLMNSPMLTVIDLIIFYCHLDSTQRHKILNLLKETNLDSCLEFELTLRRLDRKFIKPIRQCSKKDHPTKNSKEIARITARRLVPFITLVIEDYRIQVDTMDSYQKAKQSQRKRQDPLLYNGKQQVQAINKMASNKNGYYIWEISPFIELEDSTEKALDALPHYQFRLSQITLLLDYIYEILETHRSFLQLELFQNFMIKFLENIKKESNDLSLKLTKIDECLAKDAKPNRGLQAVLNPITKILTLSLETFSNATLNFEKVNNSPDFNDQQRLLLSTKIGVIDEHFMKLFGHDSGLSELKHTPAITQGPLPSPATITREMSLNPNINIVDSNQIIALRDLVQNCYNALSHFSQIGHKGFLLKDLIEQIENKKNFNPEQLKVVLFELCKITSAYRGSFFFQATYGQTRSAKALIAAIKNPELNKILPLAAIIFDHKIADSNQLTDAKIHARLSKIRIENSWQESSDNIEFVAAI
ncbi:MAG: hypothetical protein WC627_02155 [Legionella sp.]|jgi:hypothetical protein